MSVRRPTFRPSLAQTKRANQRAMDLYASCSDRPRFDVGARPARQPAQSPRPKPPGAAESDVKTAVLQYLKLSPLTAEVVLVNGGTAYNESGAPVQFYRVVKGPPVVVDVIGHLKDGTPFAIELKREGWKPAGPDAVHGGAVRERAQRAYIEHIVGLGGVGGFVRSVEEARQIIEELTTGNRPA